MKKIYVFLALLLAAGTAAQSKTIDLKATLISPANSSTVQIGVPFNFKIEFKNLGTDAIAPTDTVYFTFSGTSSTYYITGKTKAVNDTISLSTQLTISGSSTASLRFCLYSVIRNGATITDPNRANDSSCNQINVKGGVGIKTVISMNSEPLTERLTVYPNPAVGTIALNYTARGNSPVIARVFDISGREVMSYNYGAAYTGKQGFNLDINNLLPGLYFVEVRQDDVRAVGKLNKQ